MMAEEGGFVYNRTHSPSCAMWRLVVTLEQTTMLCQRTANNGIAKRNDNLHANSVRQTSRAHVFFFNKSHTNTESTTCADCDNASVLTG